MIVTEKTYGQLNAAELHEGAARITVQEIYDWAVKRGLDPSEVYVSPDFTCYGEGQEHDKHIELTWTLSNVHPTNQHPPCWPKGCARHKGKDAGPAGR